MKYDLRPELSEFLGTFMLMLVGAAAIVGDLSGPLVALAFGGTVMVMIYAVGHVGGAHFNPAITFAFAATRHFPWARVPSYLAAQLAGAIAACVLVAQLQPMGAVVARGDLSGAQAFAVEALATFLLAFVIIAVATDRRAAPGIAGLAIGAAVVLGSLVAGPLTGAAMNPARTLAPIIAGGAAVQLAIHVVGPIVGGVCGMAAYELLRRGKKPEGEGALGSAGPIELEVPR